MADTTRLRKIDQQMAALKQQLAEEKKRIRQQEKKEDDRRKYLTGAIAIDHAKINLTFRQTLEKLIREHAPEGDKYLWPELFTANDNQEETTDNENQAAQDDIQAFHSAYLAIGDGREFIRIHKIRETLAWPQERFNTVLEQLSTAYKIELQGGDPSKLTAEELESSYRDKDDQQFITISWRE